ncbi:peptide chain release factor N(5)-glutamine methyltransferase [Paenibacillus albus]|uniref:Release factor glutamine methyltransferase n=2 Tax=Paenibacillus albus TaxID=2495582 RepID=A0A3S9ACR1_9BACL|nr:peptide chain release factor N(5)-glutamine methyltransferase [Paenibacillus albus]AZN43475.1 peptide chain release factor N(5)-glutamine methyltransferase [Paenibacillus albus]
MTIADVCLKATVLLNERGIMEPRNNAELLLLHVLGLSRTELLRDWRELFPPQHYKRWRELLARKAAGEPVQYLIGEQWFYGLPFAVTPAVLIPRPETELLVEAVLEAADKLWPQARGEAGAGDGVEVPTVVDVGTGSGAIGVTLAALRPQWRVCASDLSPDALAVARTNAERHALAARMTFVQGDLLGPFAAQQPPRPGAEGHAEAQAGGVAGLRIDVLVSNPPYIPAGDIAGLQPEVRDHEPRLALDGGDDGLTPYRRMAEQLAELSAMPRIVGFELGMGQAEAVAELLRGIGAWRDVRIIDDYAGIGRHVLAVE